MTSSILGSPADLFDERNPDWVPTLEMDLGAENPAGLFYTKGKLVQEYIFTI